MGVVPAHADHDPQVRHEQANLLHRFAELGAGDQHRGPCVIEDAGLLAHRVAHVQGHVALRGLLGTELGLDAFHRVVEQHGEAFAGRQPQADEGVRELVAAPLDLRVAVAALAKDHGGPVAELVGRPGQGVPCDSFGTHEDPSFVGVRGSKAASATCRRLIASRRKASIKSSIASAATLASPAFNALTIERQVRADSSRRPRRSRDRASSSAASAAPANPGSPRVAHCGRRRRAGVRADC